MPQIRSSMDRKNNVPNVATGDSFPTLFERGPGFKCRQENLGGTPKEEDSLFKENSLTKSLNWGKKIVDSFGEVKKQRVDGIMREQFNLRLKTLTMMDGEIDVEASSKDYCGEALTESTVEGEGMPVVPPRPRAQITGGKSVGGDTLLG